MPSPSVSIPESVQRLLGSTITSVGQLELLLLVRRTRHRSWTPDAASRELHTSARSAALQLSELADRGFLAPSGNEYQYVAAGELDGTVAELERAYATYRTRVVRMIFD